MLEVLIENNRIYSHIRKKWLVKTPEEIIRQAYLCMLVNDYGYDLLQIKEEENVTGRGSAQARADFVVYKTVEDLQRNNNPLIIVECKAEHIFITEREFIQGELYARIYNAPFFVTHNGKETKFWRVKKDKSPGYREEIENIPHANATEKEIASLYAKLKVFREKEFKQVLDACHNIIRNQEKLDAAAAFDEIAKILFMKVYAERNLRKGKENVFSLEWVEEAEKYNPDYLDYIFEKTKTEFGKSVIFKKDEKILLKLDTIKSIIQRFEKYNLSETSVDTKGIAFENFLGTTFRGDLGQFFTPRPVVDFMIDMLAPKENEKICDPSCGSGGFLIRFFQKVKEQILTKINDEYQTKKKEIETSNQTDEVKNELILQLFNQLEIDTDIIQAHTQLWNLANQCIFGTDANERMARIAKMNMIMHGDGHGGIHHHDGLLNIADIQNDTFDTILTNPPFGTVVDDKKILALFQVSKNAEKQVQENLFLERFLQLLKPEGKAGIVVPESVLNNPSSAHVREVIEDNARILAVVSLPQETFVYSGASIKCSLLFLQKFNAHEAHIWQNTILKGRQEIFDSQEDERIELLEIINKVLQTQDFPQKKDFQDAQKELKQAQKEAQNRLRELDTEVIILGRRNAKLYFNYSIFLCEPEKVGVTSLGEGGDNHFPSVLQDYKNKTILYPKSMYVDFSLFDRWDVKNFHQKDYGSWDKQFLEPLSQFSTPFKQAISKQEVIQNKYQIIAKINKKGELFLRDFDEIHSYKGSLFLVPPDSFIFSKINARIGCFYYHDASQKPFVVSSEYPVLCFNIQKVLGKYVELALRFGIAQDLFNSKVAGMAKPRISLAELRQIPIPVPSLEIQQQNVDMWENAQRHKKEAEAKLKDVESAIQNFILGI